MTSSGMTQRKLFAVAAIAFAYASASKVPTFRYENTLLGHDDVPAERVGILGFGDYTPLLKAGQCKPTPGDASWPSSEEWDVFDEALSGALIKTVPLAAACYREWGNYDAGRCDAVSENWTSPYLHIKDPTSIMWPLWEGRSCLPTDDPSSTACNLGAYPVYAVNATSVEHIQLAVNFARNKGLRLVIKNTGHDYQGRSSGAGSLSVWTQNLKEIEFLPDFKLGGFEGDAVHLAAGVLTGDVVKAAHEHGASFVGGMCASVGFAGGYFAGGGHSPLSSLFGLGADHVLAVNVVTADGRFITATEKENADLFWALRGGGPSTYGVTTSVIARLHPDIHVTSSRISFQTSETVSKELFWKGVKAFFKSFDDLTKTGIYAPVNLLRDSPYYDESDYSLSAFPMLAPNKTLEEFDALIQPIFDELTDLGIPHLNDTRYFPSYHAAFKDAWPAEDLYVAAPDDIQASRLFPKKIWNNDTSFDKAFESIRQVSDGGHDIWAFAIAPGNPFNVDNAANPALREAIAFFTTGITAPDNATPEQLAETQREVMEGLMQPWREAAPASQFGGSYLNEGNVREPNWKEDFFGDKYERLLKTKEKWDPSGLFYATAGVGSDRWEVRTGDQGIQTQNGKLCRV